MGCITSVHSKKIHSSNSSIKCLLFDVDGTLINSRYRAEAGEPVRHPTLDAMQQAFSMPIDKCGVSFGGKTDKLNIRDVLQANYPSTDAFSEDSETKIRHTMEMLPSMIQKHIDKGIASYYLLENVVELLNRLSAMDDVYLGLLTGNVAANIPIKFKCAGLSTDYFLRDEELIGAFGSDGEDRNKLFPFAKKRFEQMVGVELTAANFVVIGDTPRDVECAHVNDVACVAVATGRCSVEQLTKASADTVLNDFSDLDMAVKAILNTKFG